MSISIGDYVFVTTEKEQRGFVKYIGEVKGVKGSFIGIELDTPTGKNDGTAKGDRYFDCKINHGLFVKEGGVTVITVKKN